MPESDPFEEYPLPYEEFYSEIPGSIDYLDDIGSEIQDERETESSSVGLSDEQVSMLAQDTLDHTDRTQPKTEDNELELFEREPTDT